MDNPIVYFVFNLPLPIMFSACVLLLGSTIYLSLYIKWIRWTIIPTEFLLCFVYLGSVFGWAHLDQIQNRALVRFVLSTLFFGLSGLFYWLARQIKFTGSAK